MLQRTLCLRGPLAQLRHASSLRYTEHGRFADVLSYHQDEPLAAPKETQVLVKMIAAPINPADINQIEGVYPIKPPLLAVGGNEGIGRVEKVGANVQELCVGDFVLPAAQGWGTWKEEGLSEERDLVRVPNDLDPVLLSMLTVNPCTSLRMLRDFSSLQQGDSVVLNAPLSGVGQAVVQLCKIYGLHAICVIRNRPDIQEAITRLTALGASYVVTEEDSRSKSVYADIKARFGLSKLGLNGVGGQSCLNLMRLMARRGVVVTYGGMSKEPVKVPTGALIFNDLRFVGFWMSEWY
jgi:trans-2-enoyl-CoA reductase